MAVASSTAALLGAAVTLASTAVGTWSAVSRQEEQRKQAEFSADMARRNAQMAEENARMAEEEARQTRADSYDAAVRKRQETSLLVGKQRAQAGASGAQIDSGSQLDSQLDLREKGRTGRPVHRGTGRTRGLQSGSSGLEPAQCRTGIPGQGTAAAQQKQHGLSFPEQDPAQWRRTSGQQLRPVLGPGAAPALKTGGGGRRSLALRGAERAQYGRRPRQSAGHWLARPSLSVFVSQHPQGVPVETALSARTPHKKSPRTTSASAAGDRSLEQQKAIPPRRDGLFYMIRKRAATSCHGPGYPYCSGQATSGKD